MAFSSVNIICKNTFLHVVAAETDLPLARKHRRSTAPPECFAAFGGDMNGDSSDASECQETSSRSSSKASDSVERHTSDSILEKKRQMTYQPTTPDADVYTVMVRGIPCSCTREEILDAIDEVGFKGKHDFFYIPSRHSKYLGYAFVGFPDSQLADSFTKAMTGYRFKGRKSPKVVYVTPAHIQGREQNIEHFKGTFVMGTKRSPLFDGREQQAYENDEQQAYGNGVPPQMNFAR